MQKKIVNKNKFIIFFKFVQCYSTEHRTSYCKVIYTRTNP